jgi:hypothetical protein
MRRKTIKVAEYRVAETSVSSDLAIYGKCPMFQTPQAEQLGGFH